LGKKLHDFGGGLNGVKDESRFGRFDALESSLKEIVHVAIDDSYSPSQSSFGNMVLGCLVSAPDLLDADTFWNRKFFRRDNQVLAVTTTKVIDHVVSGDSGELQHTDDFRIREQYRGPVPIVEASQP
jgi:hypothetical protein